MSDYITQEEYNELARLWVKVDAALKLISHTAPNYPEYGAEQVHENGIAIPYIGESYGDTFIAWETIPVDWILHPIERLEGHRKEQEEKKIAHEKAKVEWDRKQYEKLKAQYG